MQLVRPSVRLTGALAAMIYLDYNATTPLDPACKTAITKAMDVYGNPSSGHALGQDAKASFEHARAEMAGLLNAAPADLTIVSCGTESINWCLRGAALQAKAAWGGSHIVTSAVEHDAVLETVKYLVAEHGFTSTLVCVDEYGMVTAAAVADALTPQTCLVSVMHSNNEVGTIMPIAEIAATLRAAREPGAPPILFHSDTSQSLGKVVVDVAALGVDYATITGHKLYAPKGIGALYAKPGNPPLRKLMVGAGHEGGRRAGTESTLLASGLGAACAVAKASLAEANGGDGEGEGSGVGGGATAKLAYLRDRLETRVIAGMGGAASGKVRVNGHPTLRLPNTCSLSFRGCLAPQLLRAVEHRVACSAGAACHTASMDGITNNDSGDDPRVSHVLRAMRVPLEYARGTLRLSVGRFTTEAEVDEAADLLVAAATKAFEQPI